MSFWAELISNCDQCTRDSLLIFLKEDCARPQIICCGESSMKKIYKVMESNQQFLKDHYQFWKDVLHPKCAIQLQCDQSLLDTFIAKTLSEPPHNILLSSLDGSPPPPIPLFSSHSKYKKKYILT